jgi:hypothetical protein
MSPIIKTLEMSSEDRFVKLEEQITYIYDNMTLLMVALEKKFGPFGEVGGSNLEVGLEKKMGDSGDLENEPKKSQRNQPPLSSLLHNIYLEWKRKWTSYPTKVILLVLLS